MGMRDLPDMYMYALGPRAAGPTDEGNQVSSHTKHPECVTYYVSLFGVVIHML